MGDVIQHPLDPNHALRATEAAEGGRRLRVCLQPMRLDAHIGQEIRIIRVQHGPVGHWQRQIHRPATPAELQKLHALDHTFPIDADTVRDAEIMPLPGYDHVVVAVIAHGTRPAGQLRGNSTGYGQRVALAFLAAKPSAHTAYFAAHRIHRHAQSLGNLVLNLGRMLGRGMNDHVASLLWQGTGSLAFQIEVLLPADIDRTLDHMRRSRYRSGRIALLVNAWAILEAAVCRQRLLNRKDRRQGFVFNLGKTRRLARQKMCLGNHQENRLTHVIHPPLGQHRLGPRRGRHVVVVWQVFCGQNRDHALCRAHGSKVDRRDRAMRHFARAKGQVKGIPRKRQIIDVPRLPRHVQTRSIMGKRLGHAHGAISRTLVAAPEMSWK